MDYWDIFLAAGLTQPGCAERNLNILKTVESAGMTIFAPQIELPLHSASSAEEILQRNSYAIRNSRLFLFVPDGAGEGVFYELGLADAQDKTVIGFSPNGIGDYGKIVQARWDRLPAMHRTRSLEELADLLSRFA